MNSNAAVTSKAALLTQARASPVQKSPRHVAARHQQLVGLLRDEHGVDVVDQPIAGRDVSLQVGGASKAASSSCEAAPLARRIGSAALAVQQREAAGSPSAGRAYR